ncbi:hypothetical protein NGRA_1455, partial [Nosema granulosis]
MFENVTLKLKIEEKEGAKDMNIYTSASEIIIGTGLDCNLRIHEPSIERYHLKINIPNKQVWVMGKDVYLNDNLLDVNAHHSFEYGDTIRIHRVFITLQPTEPNTETNGKYILKHIPDIMKENDVNVVSFDQEQIGTNVYVNNIGKVSDGQVDDKIVDDKIVDDKIVDDKIVDGNKETTIEREIISNQFIEGGILHQEITERIHIEEVEEIIICDKKEEETSIKEEEEETSIKEEEEETSIKDVPEIQQAVKILEDGNVEMALEDGDLTTVKEAINLKKEDLNTDIRDTIEAESTVSDTPIDPSISKRVVKDLGEVVLEKEILSDAEKIVDEKIVDEKKDEEAIEKNEKDSVETVSVEENKNQVENKVE